MIKVATVNAEVRVIRWPTNDNKSSMEAYAYADALHEEGWGTLHGTDISYDGKHFEMRKYRLEKEPVL